MREWDQMKSDNNKKWERDEIIINLSINMIYQEGRNELKCDGCLYLRDHSHQNNLEKEREMRRERENEICERWGWNYDMMRERKDDKKTSHI